MVLIEGAARAPAPGIPSVGRCPPRVLEALERSETPSSCAGTASPRPCRSSCAEYLRRLEAFEDVEAEDRAFLLAEAHGLPLLALQFRVAWPALPRAARYVIEHWEEWDGEAFEIYARCRTAERGPPPGRHPVAEGDGDVALSMGRAKRYRYAAEHLRSCEQLAAVSTTGRGLRATGSSWPDCGRPTGRSGASGSRWER